MCRKASLQSPIDGINNWWKHKLRKVQIAKCRYTRVQQGRIDTFSGCCDERTAVGRTECINMNTSYTELVLAGLVLILPFLYESSHVFRFYLKFMIYYVWVSLMAVVLMPVFCTRPKNVKNLVWVCGYNNPPCLLIFKSHYRIAGRICGPVTTLIGLRWIVRNTEYLKKDQACIIVSNHQSSLDILGEFS